MEIERLESVEALGWTAPVVTIGNFDGVHRGHQALVAVAHERARATGGTSVVLTFDPHPGRVLSPDRAPAALMTFAQKSEVLGELEVERLAVLPFTLELASRTPADFARSVLCQTLGARMVVVGETFRFGRGRSGDVAALVALGRDLEFEVVAVPPVVLGGGAVSSSRVRGALEAGDVRAAGDLLGRPFFVDGEVVHGAARGSALGFPTANVSSENEILPVLGVYACWCQVDQTGPRMPAVANVGRRPTFGGGAVGIEAHVLDWSGDLYGRRVRVAFAERLREERAFGSVGALVEQIAADVAGARRVLEKA